MGPFQRAVELYPYVFHPITVLGAGVLLLVRHEWREQSRDGEREGSLDRGDLWKRVGAFLGAGVLALVPTGAFFLLRRGSLSRAFQGSSWRMDVLVALGIFVAAGVTWLLWHRFEWGSLVPDAMVVLVAVTIPYIVLSPFWDVSGHVTAALMPTLYLALVDRRYAPLLAIPILMVPNRVLVEAHTWLQSVTAFAIAAAITVGLYRFQSRTARAKRGESTPQ